MLSRPDEKKVGREREPYTKAEKEREREKHARRNGEETAARSNVKKRQTDRQTRQADRGRPRATDHGILNETGLKTAQIGVRTKSWKFEVEQRNVEQQEKTSLTHRIYRAHRSPPLDNTDRDSLA